jgi:hypothetical protein
MKKAIPQKYIQFVTKHKLVSKIRTEIRLTCAPKNIKRVIIRLHVKNFFCRSLKVKHLGTLVGNL